MKTNPRRLGILAATAIALATAGCGTTKEGAVNEAPPAAQEENIPPAPNANYLWAGGHWARQNGQWAWQSGRWMMRPGIHAIWEPGTWEQTGHGWVWREGQWRDTIVP